MEEKYQNKYRIKSARAEWWNYSNAGCYFITICTKNREHFFGEVVDGKMRLTTMGAIVQGFWYDIPYHFSDIRLGAFVVMPNHIHGILILDKSVSVETLHCNVSTDTEKNKFYSQISPKPGSVSTIIRSYKSICTKHIRKTFPMGNFAWQPRFWDHIIRDHKAYQRIEEYIYANPVKWKIDRFYK